MANYSNHFQELWKKAKVKQRIYNIFFFNFHDSKISKKSKKHYIYALIFVRKMHPAYYKIRDK